MGLDIGFDSQTPSLPQGGGAVSSLGETFTPDLATGVGYFTIRFDCPNGPNDIGPRLVIRYSTGDGNGPFGLGFSLPLLRLVRSTSSGFPSYDASDTITLEGAGDLVSLGGGAYRPQVDAGVWRAEASGSGFKLTDRDGTYYFLGTSPGSQLLDASDSSAAQRVFAWHLERIEDPLGDTATFTWQRDGNQLYLSSVAYGPYEVAFHYVARPDLLRWGRAGFMITTSLLCDTVELHLFSTSPHSPSPQSLVRRWTLSYAQDGGNGSSLLTGVVLSGFDDAGARLDAPPLSMAYSASGVRALRRFQSLDGVGPGPLSRTNEKAELLDWEGDGLPDLLEISGDGHALVWPNIGNYTWGHPLALGRLPLFATPESLVGLVDMNGDGVADLIRPDRLVEGYIPHLEGGGFGPPVNWTRAPYVQADSPNARLVDLNGDGTVDLLVSSIDNLELFYRSDAVGGWLDQPQLVPRSDVGEAGNLVDPYVFLADMTGDGSYDLVVVKGGVTYRPYLGMGRWAEPVTMANPPTLPFDAKPERIFLEDIDGDGCADLIYLDDDGKLLYWINQSGNGFGNMQEIDYIPTSQINEVRVVDMTGSGMAGLLWSTTGPAGRTVYFYLEFTGGIKSCLLTRVENGVGLVTAISYTTSTQESVMDAQAHQKWATFFPISVPVTAEIVSVDSATGRATTSSYRYHDGRFDGVLREFAGFGRVDADQVGDETAPTLRTTTWFHTGVDPANPSKTMTLDERERLRAIRGRIYKQERYGLDGSSLEPAAYDRLEQQWQVETESTAGGNVYVPRLITTIRSNLERAPSAASLLTTTNTAWDSFGNVTDSLETSEETADPTTLLTLRTHVVYAQDGAGRFLSRVFRIQQFDGADNVVADTITQFDGAPEGSVGAQGLVTRRSALVLSDALVAAVYGSNVPDFSKLGYYRRAGETGWWIDQASYKRTDDSTGLHGVVTGPLGAAVTFDFDPEKMYPVRMVDSRGNTVLAQHDYRVCRVAQLTDASGETHFASFDQLARLVAEVEPGDTPALPTVAYEHITSRFPVETRAHRRAVSGAAQAMDVRELVDGCGLTIERRVSDDAGEIISASNQYSSRGFLSRTYIERRPAGSLYAAPDDTIAHTVYRYDALGRLVYMQHYDGSFRTSSYLPLELVGSDEEDTRTDAGATHANTPTRKWFDATGRVKAIEENLSGTWIRSTYRYDVKGNLVSHADAIGNLITSQFDFLGRALRVDRPEDGTTSVYDAAGNVVEARGRDGSVVLREFDPLNRLSTVRYAQAAPPAVRFTYQDSGLPAPPDAGAHTNGGRCVRVDDEGGTTILDYDERGRVALKRSRPVALAGKTFDLGFAYRADDQLASIEYPDDGSGTRVTVAYQYDARGNVSGVPGVADKVTYDLAGRRTEVRYSNGAVQSYNYDELKRTLSAMQLSGTSGTLRSAQFTLDLVGNLLRVDSPDPKVAFTHIFDDLYRLTQSMAASGESWTFAYDVAGNISNKSDVGAYRYGEHGAPATCLTSAGTQSFSYNARGQMSVAPWGTQTFDAAGRLKSIVGTGGRMDFLYDYAGMRASAHSTGVAPGVDEITPDRLYSIEGGTLVLSFFDGMGVAARQQAGGAKVFLHFDQVGGLVAVTDSTGQAVSTLRYDPYGKLLERTGPGPSIPVGFTGGVPEPMSGLLYLRARYYNPALGCFVTPDLVVQDILNPVAWMPFVYCRDNPVSYVDPTGLSWSPWKIFAVVVAIVVLVVLTVVTFGAGTALWGAAAGAMQAVFVSGVVAGGVVGGISAYQHGGDILEGILVGAAVGGGAAFVGGSAGIAVSKAVGVGTLVGDIAAGAVNGAVNGAAMGFAAGFGGGKGSLTEIWEKMFFGGLAGAAIGAGLGALSHLAFAKPASQTFETATARSDPTTPAMPPSEGGPSGTQATTSTRAGDPLGDVALPGAAKVAEKVLGPPTISTSVTAPVLNSPVFQTITVDLTVGAAALTMDYLIAWVHNQLIAGQEEKVGPIKSPSVNWG